jgi:hypothetical protein
MIVYNSVKKLLFKNIFSLDAKKYEIINIRTNYFYYAQKNPTYKNIQTEKLHVKSCMKAKIQKK